MHASSIPIKTLKLNIKRLLGKVWCCTCNNTPSLPAPSTGLKKLLGTIPTFPLSFLARYQNINCMYKLRGEGGGGSRGRRGKGGRKRKGGRRRKGGGGGGKGGGGGGGRGRGKGGCMLETNTKSNAYLSRLHDPQPVPNLKRQILQMII
jgi:hypothetical protein